MTVCKCCRHEVASDAYLFNHIIRHSRYDSNHRLFFQTFINEVKELFYDNSFFGKTTYKTFTEPQTIKLSYVHIRRFWFKEFGNEATMKRSNLMRRKSIAIATIANNNNCSRQAAEKLLVDNYDLSHIESNKLADCLPDINQSDTCPICHKPYGKSLLAHCKKYFSTHKNFIEQQNQLIIPLFYNYSITSKTDLNQFNVRFNYNYCLCLWKEHYGKYKIEERRKILERNTKNNQSRIIPTNIHRGTKSKFDLTKYLDRLTIPKVNFYTLIAARKNILTTCPCCGEDISKTTMWNHLVLMKHEKQHDDFIIQQLNLALKLFNNLDVNVNDKTSLYSHDLYMGLQVIKDLWNNCFSKELIIKRKQLRKQQSTKHFLEIIPYSKPYLGNPYSQINYSQINFNLQINKNIHYSENILNNVHNKICPICHQDIGRSFFEHLKHNRIEQNHLQLFEEQIQLAIQLFLCKNLQEFKKLESNLLISLNTCEKIIWPNLFTSKELKEHKINAEHIINNYQFAYGYRKDIDCIVRSSWEANVYRIFKYHYGNQFKEMFMREIPFNISVPTKQQTYIVDICDNVGLFDTPGTYIEIKGSYNERAKYKEKMFKQLYPQYKLIFIGCPTNDFHPEISYKDLENEYKDKIPLWETAERNLKNHPWLFK